MSGIAETRTGLAGQFGFATESEVALNTIVTPDTFLEVKSVGGSDDTTVLRSEGMTGGVVLGTGRRREIFHGAVRELTFDLLTKGFAKLLYHSLGGYSISWPGSTNGDATLTLGGAVPTDGETVTIGSQTYTWKASLTSPAVANEVLIGADTAACAANFAAAVNRGFLSNGQGPGDVYSLNTPRNEDVTAEASTNTVTVTDKQARGAAVNSGGSDEVATTETMADLSNVWDNATLTGGVNGTDTERVHTFTLDATRLWDLAMTAQVVIPPSEAARQAFTYAGGKVTQLGLAVAQRGQLELTTSVHFRSRDLNTAIATASFASGATFYDFSEIAVQIDDVATAVRGYSLTVPIGYVTDRSQLGTATPRNQLLAERVVMTGELNREFENIDLYSAWLNGTPAKIVATATGDTIPGSGNPYKTVITLPEVHYTGSTPQLSGTGVQENNIPFEVMNDGTNEPITIEYRTDDLWAG